MCSPDSQAQTRSKLSSGHVIASASMTWKCALGTPCSPASSVARRTCSFDSVMPAAGATAPCQTGDLLAARRAGRRCHGWGDLADRKHTVMMRKTGIQAGEAAMSACLRPLRWETSWPGAARCRRSRCRRRGCAGATSRHTTPTSHPRSRTLPPADKSPPREYIVAERRTVLEVYITPSSIA